MYPNLHRPLLLIYIVVVSTFISCAIYTGDPVYCHSSHTHLRTVTALYMSPTSSMSLMVTLTPALVISPHSVPACISPRAHWALHIGYPHLVTRSYMD